MTPAKILIVEDNRIVAMDIEAQLQRIGYSVVGITGRGEDVLSMARAGESDLVLMDIRLEGKMDGIEAASLVRRELGVPVVFLTAYADDVTVTRARTTEPFGYLLKPFEDLQLRTVIEMALYKHAAEAALRASERRFVTTLSSIGDAVIATDEKSSVTFINPVAEALTGWSASEASGMPLNLVFRTSFKRVQVEPTSSTAQDASAGASTRFPAAVFLFARDGREIPIESNVSPIFSDHGVASGSVLVFRDVSDRRRFEASIRAANAQLLRATRLLFMSELAASIADEINQPLTSIAANADACVLWLRGAQPDLESVTAAALRIVQDAHGAAQAIRGIRALVQKPALVFAPFDLVSAVQEVLEILDADLRHAHVAVEVELPSQPMIVNGDRVQLQQVLANLVLNGAKAMGSGDLATRILRVSASVSAGRFVVCVGNTATREASPHMSSQGAFDASRFREEEIGLSLCRDILGAHGGELHDSQADSRGSIYQITLPSFARS